MKKFFVAAATLAMAVVSMPTHAEIQKWVLVAKVRTVDDGFEPPPFLQVGAKVKVVYTVDVDAPLDTYEYDALPRIRFDHEGSATDAGYVLAWTGLTALNTAFKKPREDGVDFVSYNCMNERAPVSVSDALAICASMVRHFDQTQIRFDFGSNSVHAEPLSFEQVTKP